MYIMTYTKKNHKKHTIRKRKYQRRIRKKVTKHKRKVNPSKRVMRRKSRKNRRHSNKKNMRGGVQYVPSNADLSNINETVPYKVGTGVPAGKGSLPINGRNYYKLSPDLHAPNGEIMNTSLHTSVPKTFLSNQQGGSGLTKLMPQDLVNLGRSIIGSAETLYDNWQGQEPPVSSNVMVQPINKTKNPIPKTIDINKLEMNADIKAASV